MQASDRPSGYLSDVTFPDRFHRELSPAWLNYVGVLGGIPPRDFDRPFTYLDLGCGFAHSTIINAGAFPQAEFHACDFNPAHIEAAARRAAELGIENVVFHESSFEELLDKDLPSFDFIVLHGIYSWVDANVRNTLQQIISRKLEDGGLVYLSYNCFPGWSAETPLRKLMLELSQAAEGSVERRTGAALDTMQQLGNPSFKYFRENPAAVEAVTAFSNDPVNYLAHEFLNGTWEVHYSVDVADDMARTGLTYVGSATLADNHAPLTMDKQAAESIAALPNARLRHLAADFAVNRRFRRDVFVRGTPTGNAPRHSIGSLDDAIVGCVPDVEQIDIRVNIPRGVLSFQADFIGDLRSVLAQGAMRIGDIVARLSGPQRNAMEIRQNLLFLVAAGALTPFAKAGGYPNAASRQAENAVIGNAIKRIVERSEPAFVPCELLGNGVLVNVEEAIAMERWLTDEGAARPERLARLGLV
ncbi:class I SAM-dependent methyltransferase [Trinickia fusca]|uniref:Methyltransferase domain-containing protein n=1 Tax=Trinickia fusca TaxID=2419777 RepID=A0A494X9X1_9BURK|nr:class I SAM-dependent methyltransferase [Trinickia fusca]RKP47525.1 methyltransferase domain-containing protein [Trinickia fusca]